MNRIYLVIPCFNEEDVLAQLFERVDAVMSNLQVEWKVVCIDDGSTDGTWGALKTKCETDPHWSAVRFSRNFGHQTAVSAGIALSSEADAVVIMDSDLQDPPEVIPEFLQAWVEGAEVVFAVRRKRKEGLFLRIAYWGFYRVMSRLATFEIPLDSGDFSLLDRKAVAALNAMPERNRFVRGLRSWAGFRQVGVEYERAGRAAGATKYTLRKLIKLASDGIFNFSGKPLRLAAHLGFFVSTISLLGVVFTLAQRIFYQQFSEWGLAPVPGFATIVISILFLGGVQLICLGIIGEYLMRIFEEVKQRPTWIVSESAGLEVEARRYG